MAIDKLYLRGLITRYFGSRRPRPRAAHLAHIDEQVEAYLSPWNGGGRYLKRGPTVRLECICDEGCTGAAKKVTSA